MMSGNLRRTYILETLGLSHDPFAGPVAEQELRGGEKEPHFFSYYTDPKESKLNKPVWQALREARNGLIFGEPGSGKTTLRYILEAECRSVYDRTLVVTYELSHRMAEAPMAEEHWTSIAAELAIDLFIQVIEQFDTFDSPTEAQKQQLRDQMALVWSRLRRTVDLILKDDFSDRENGLATLWPRLNRPAVRYIDHSPKIINLIKDCLPEETESPQTQPGEELLRAGVTAAKMWGFKQIFVLVDGLDAYEREIEKMQNLIAPLLADLAKRQAEDIYFYFFLIADMEAPLAEGFGEIFNSLPFPPIWYIIDWEESALMKLLHQRLRAAGSRVPGFYALVASDARSSLENSLLEAAHNSPRQLLRVVSALIDAHAQSEPDRILITAADWNRMKDKWSYGTPLPPELNTNGYSP